MQFSLRKLATVFMLAIALVLGVQRPPVLACGMDDAACHDHCAIAAASCATACPAPLAPLAVGWPARAAAPQAVAFSSDQPLLTGRSISPDSGPPRLPA
jgi:hypothetical protein